MSSEQDSGLSRRKFLEAATIAVGAVTVGSACGDDSAPASPDAGSPADAMAALDAGELDARGFDMASAPDTSSARDVSYPDAGGYEPVPDGFAAVAVTGHEDVETRVRRAIVAAGGIDAIGPGDTVFIKPNAVHSFVRGSPAIVTDPAFLAAVVRIVRERSPARIIVGDRPARPFLSEPVLETTGHRRAAMEAGADEVYPAPRPVDEPDAWVLLQPDAYEETWDALGGVLAMRAIVEADHFINLPVCKDHRWAVYSLSMKNLIGAVGDDSRDAMHYVRSEPNRLSRDIAILNQMFSPLINILDAGVALLNGGPEGTGPDSVRARPGLTLASRDRVALDVVGVSLIQHELARATVEMPDEAHPFLTSTRAWDLPQVVHGIDRGLGIGSPDRLILRFEEVVESTEIEARARS